MPLSRRMTTSNILRIFTLRIEGKIFEKEIMSQTDMDARISDALLSPVT